MKKLSKNIFLVFFCFLFFQPLYSQKYIHKLWLKKRIIVFSKKLELSEKGFTVSENSQIDFNSLDSMRTIDSSLVKRLVNQYKKLRVRNRPDGFLITGFENIEKRNAVNFGIELWGKSLVGGINVSYIYHEKHSFDFGYGNGEASTSFFGDVKAENIYYVSYSYLSGKNRFKRELGMGISYGKGEFTEISMFSETTEPFKGLMFSGTLGMRYQR